LQCESRTKTLVTYITDKLFIIIVFASRKYYSFVTLDADYLHQNNCWNKLLRLPKVNCFLKALA